MGRFLLRQIGVHPEDSQAFRLEMTVPYYLFLDSGMQVDVASPSGGIVPVDPLSVREMIRTRADDRMLGDDVFRFAPISEAF